jgi:CRISPR-associated protein Cmr2
MAYLLGVTVGPIQSNIEKSKKLKDLCNSSKIVSDIMLEIKNYLIKKGDKEIDIIYPAIDDDNDIDLTNYMICKINGIDGLDEIFEGFKNDKNYKYLLNEIYFIFWAVEPLTKSYPETYKKLVKKIRSIKNTYEFESYSKNEEKIGKKCSLCGERLRAQGELCEICNDIRNYKDSHFESVYDISIAIWKKENKEVLGDVNNVDNVNAQLEHLFEPENTAKYYNFHTIENLLGLLENSYDPDKAIREKKIKRIKETKKIKEMYEDLKDPKIELEIGLEALIKRIKAIKGKLENIYQKEKNPVKEHHYQYCFVKMDVDDLGKWIGGEFNKDINNLENSQREISNYLCQFAYTLKGEFKDNNTRVIYAGGDDFLAVLPVESLLYTLYVIEEKFKEIVQDKIEESTNYKKKITYSVSVTLANCKDDMAVALRQNRIVLENVKERFEKKEPFKNGIAINYIVNTTKIINMYLKKHSFKDYVDNLRYWRKIKDVSFNYIDAIVNEFNKMKYEDLEIEELSDLKHMMILEFKRYLGKNKRNKDCEELKEYISKHTKLFENIVNENIFDKRIDFENIISCFQIYEKLTNFYFTKAGELNETT